MNSQINIYKFILAIYIGLLHISGHFGYDKFPYFQGGYIFVEWFFVFAGFTLAKKIINLDKNIDIFNTSCNLIKNRILNIYPYYFLSCIFALGFHFTGGLVIEESWTIFRIIHEFLMLQMTSISVFSLTGTSWFLSSMWLIFIIFVPLLLKFRRKFGLSLIIISIMLTIFMFLTDNHMHGTVEWTLIGYKGNLRAMSAISLGIFSYSFFSLFSKNLNDYNISIIIGIFDIILSLFVIYYVFIFDDGIAYFILPYVFAIHIGLEMTRKQINFIKDNNFTRFLGAFSMIFYMNHFYVQTFYQFLLQDKIDLIRISIISFAVSILISLIIYFIVYLFKRINKKVVIKI